MTPPIPVFVNPAAGSAPAMLKALGEDARFRIVEVAPGALGEEMGRVMAEEPPLVLVAGGDGTLAGAAGVLVGRATALGVLPAGTLNHFAHDHGLPMDPGEAVRVALEGTPTAVDLGALNQRFFLNTSAVGAYVPFVRIRNRWQPYLGYYLASLVAAIVAFVRMRSFPVQVEVDGEVRRYRSPLVFVGVDERELRPPKLGKRRPGGRRGLHLLIVRRTPRWRLLAMAVRALTRGIRPWAGESEVESLLVDRCTVNLPRAGGRVAADGEVFWVHGALEYECRRDAITVMLPGRETRR